MKILYSNEFLDIEMINPNYPFLHMKKRGAVVVPYDNKGNIYLLKKNRKNIGTYYEVPRGFVESEESFQVGALRELFEETGMESLKTELLGIVQPDTGVMNNSVKIYAMLVRERKDYYKHYDYSDKEVCNVVKVSLEQISQLILEGRIICSYTLSGICMFKAKNNKLIEREDKDMLEIKIPDSKDKIKKQIEALKYQLNLDTREEDKKIHSNAIKSLEAALKQYN